MARLLSTRGSLMTDIIQVESINDIEKKICINVTPEIVNKKFDEFFNNIKKDASVPGFRKGKAPIEILRKRYHNQAEGAISQMLISEFYQNAIKEHNINPIGNPVIKNKNSTYVGEFHSDNSYSVEMQVEVLPKIDPIGYNDLDINLPESNMDDICETRMGEYQEQFAEREQITDSGAIKDDTVVIDFTGFVDGKPFDGGSATGFAIEKLDNNTLIPGFEEKLIGLKSGDTDRIKVVFPDTYNVSHLAGQEAEFEITILSIVRKTKAKVDNDLALMAGFASVKDMRAKIKQEALLGADKANRQFAETVISTQLIEKNQFNVPNILIKYEEERLLKASNIQSPDDILKTQLYNISVQNVKRALLLDAIYEKEEDIKVDPEQLNEFLEEQAAIHNKSKDDIVSLLYNTNQMDSFVGVLKTKNVIDFLIKINKKESE